VELYDALRCINALDNAKIACDTNGVVFNGCDAEQAGLLWVLGLSNERIGCLADGGGRAFLLNGQDALHRLG
jgi:hypothetical protein